MQPKRCTGTPRILYETRSRRISAVKDTSKDQTGCRSSGVLDSLQHAAESARNFNCRSIAWKRRLLSRPTCARCRQPGTSSLLAGTSSACARKRADRGRRSSRTAANPTYVSGPNAARTQHAAGAVRIRRQLGSTRCAGAYRRGRLRVSYTTKQHELESTRLTT
jgi:hypothetical protein